MSRLYANSSVPKKATMTSKCVGGESLVLLVVTTLALTAEYIRRISAFLGDLVKIHSPLKPTTKLFDITNNR